MSERDPDSFPRQGYEGLWVDRRVARPEGDENFQRGLTFEWLVPTGHWVAVSDGGLDNWLSFSFSPDEVQPRVLGSSQRCTHENPQFDSLVDRGRFGPCENEGVKGAEHSDPREPLEDHQWGLGFLSSLTEVVEEDMTSDDETSSDDSSTEAIETEITSSDEEVK